MTTSLRDRTDASRYRQLEFDFERRTSLVEQLRRFILRRRADAMLRATLRPYRVGSASELTPHLLKDIGLPPDFRM